MRINSNAMANVFKAYTKQLRADYAKADREGQFKSNPAKGFEQVSLSKEAVALAAGNEAKKGAEAEEANEKDEKSPAENEDPSKAEADTGGNEDHVASAKGSEDTNK